MRKYLLIILLATSFSTFSQPKLDKISLLNDLPKLTIENFNDDFRTLPHDQGIILYSAINNTWKLYEYLEGYEQYGRIKNVTKGGKTFLICFEDGSLILRKNKIKILDYNIHTIQILQNEILCFATISKNHIDFEANPGYISDYSKYYYLLKIDINNLKVKEVPIKNPIRGTGIENTFECTFYQDQLLILNHYRGIDHSRSLLYLVDQAGTTSRFMKDYWFNKFPISIKTFVDKLYVLTSDTIYKIRNDSIVDKIHITPEAWKYKHHSTILKEDKLLVFQKRRLLEFDLINSVIQREEELYSSFSFGYKDQKIIENDVYLIYDNYLIRYNINNLKEKKYFYIKNNFVDQVWYFVEDSSEIWCFSQRNGISRFKKRDSLWTTYTDFIEFYNDSSEWLTPSDITLNSDYVFLHLDNHDHGTNEFLVFNRTTEKFTTFSKQEFLNKFLYLNEDLFNYKNEVLVYKGEDDLLHQFLNENNVWLSFLFFYTLPLSGTGYRNHIIQNNKFCILSSKFKFNKFKNGLVLYNKTKKSINLRSLSKLRSIQSFKGSRLYIYGELNEIWGHGIGNYEKGIFRYYPNDLSYLTKKEWVDTFHECSNLEYLDDYLFIQLRNRGSYVMNKNTFEITKADSLYPNLKIPRYGLNYYKTDRCFYLFTPDEMVYFDHNFNVTGTILGKFELGKSFKTDMNLYLYTDDSFYLLIEDL